MDRSTPDTEGSPFYHVYKSISIDPLSQVQAMQRMTWNFLPVQQLENFQNSYKGKTENAWATWRIVVVAGFFGLLIFFGVICAFFALLDRTPRLTATFTLFLWIWTGFVLLLGAGESVQKPSHLPRSFLQS